MAPVGAAPDGFAPVQQVDHHEKCQVQHATAHSIAHCQVRRLGQGHAGNAGGQLGQRGDAGNQRQANPAPRQPGVPCDGIAIARELKACGTDQGCAGSKLHPGPGSGTHAARSFQAKGDETGRCSERLGMVLSRARRVPRIRAPAADGGCKSGLEFRAPAGARGA